MIDTIPFFLLSLLLLSTLCPPGPFLTSADLTFISAANPQPKSVKGKQDFALMFSVEHGDLSKIQPILNLAQ